MRDDKPFLYAILVQGRKVGPFDRRTVVGMRVKKMLEDEHVVIRNDGLQMNVGELIADRFEMADHFRPNDTQSRNVAPPASGIWPTFLVDFGGGLRAGAFGFTGRGELRYQGDLLRLTGRMKTGLIGTNEERIKVPLSGFSSVRFEGLKVLLQLRPDQPYDEARRGVPSVVTLENDFAVQELQDLLKLSEG